MSLEIKNLTMQAGQFTLSGASMCIPTGQCGILMGRSGSGKTTLMEALCGLRQVLKGSVMLGERCITHLRPCERGIGLVPQDTVLFPQMTVKEHLAFGPELAGWEKQTVCERVEELSEAMGIVDLLDRKPQGLSGGEAKRVSLGRAIAVRPQLLCLDEALTGLDPETHSSIMKLLKKIIAQEKLTTLYITHQQSEAEALGQIIYKIQKGGIAVQ
jgi:ABC-type sugar transport system ATPase subunit